MPSTFKVFYLGTGVFIDPTEVHCARLAARLDHDCAPTIVFHQGEKT